MRAFAEFAMRGWFQAALVAAGTGMIGASVPLLFPLMWVSGGAVALVTLHRGPYAGLKVLGVASAFTAIVGQLAVGGPILVAGLVLGYWLPALLLAAVLRTSVSLSLSMLMGALVGIAPVLLAYLLLGEPAAWWERVLTPLFDNFVAAKAMKAEQAAETLPLVARYFSVVLGLSICLGGIGGLMVGRYWQAELFNAGGFKAEFLDLRLGRVASVVAAVLMLMAVVLKWDLLVDLSLTLAVIFVFQTIAVGNKAVALNRLNKGLLLAIYVGIAILLSPAILVYIMVMFGMVDNWLDVRARLAVPQS